MSRSRLLILALAAVTGPTPAAGQAPAASACCLVGISVSDVARSASWYRRELAFELVRPPTAMTADVSVAMLQRAGLRLELVQIKGARARRPAQADSAESASLRGLFKLGLQVPRLDPLLARLRAHGVPVTRPYADSAFGVRYAFLSDPDGNDIQLLEPLRPKKR